MKTSHIQTLLVIGIGLLILLFPAYLRFSSLAGAYIFSMDISFEDVDQDDILKDSQSEPGVFSSDDFSTAMLPWVKLLQQTVHFLPQISFLDQGSFFPRC